MKSNSERSVCIELRSLSHQIYRLMGNRPNRKKLDSATGTNGWIIGYLVEHSDEDVYQKDIEKEFNITRSTASKIINLMEKKGLVKRCKVEHDARLNKIMLTESSVECANYIREDMRHLEQKITEGFTKEEKANLIDYMERMKKNIEKENFDEKEIMH